MEERAKQDQKWWHKHLAVIPVIIVAGVLVTALMIVIVLGYLFKWDWTGLNATDFTSPPQNIIRTIVYQPGKTLWDWLQLLFVPAVLTLGAVWITARQNHDLQIADQQRRSERELAEDKYRENTLQDYLDKMSELLLKEHLGELTEDGKLKPKYEQVRKIARVRTLTVLHRLDGWRKGGVLQFLYESGLIYKSGLLKNSETIIRLYFADLSGANLHGVSLGGAELSQTNLKGADLSGANLKGATMADGSIHP